VTLPKRRAREGCDGTLDLAGARAAAAAMTDKLTIAVTYDSDRGQVGTASDLRASVIALSLGGLRRKVEALMLPEDVIVTARGRRCALLAERCMSAGLYANVSKVV